LQDVPPKKEEVVNKIADVLVVTPLGNGYIQGESPGITQLLLTGSN
jgi:hypothetical protein